MKARPYVHRRSNRRRGSAMVESSLILVVFLFMIIGIMDFAQFLFVHQSLTESARKAARYGVVNSSDLEAIRNVVLYDKVAAPTGAVPRFGLTPSMVSVQHRNPGEASNRLVVTISGYPFHVLSPPMAGVLRGMPIVASLPVEAP